ncbi:MAG: hypothetical protein QXO51_04800 [Halobacteria archaeon]
MPFLLRVELVDDERASRVDGFEIKFESQQMAYGLLALVRKNAEYSGRSVEELGAPVDASKARSRLFERLGRRSDAPVPGPARPVPGSVPPPSAGLSPDAATSQPPRPRGEGGPDAVGAPSRPREEASREGPAQKRSLLWLKR